MSRHICDFPNPLLKPRHFCEYCGFKWRYDKTTGQWFRDFE